MCRPLRSVQVLCGAIDDRHISAMSDREDDGFATVLQRVVACLTLSKSGTWSKPSEATPHWTMSP
jgi:hypothetical protein